MCCLLHLFKVFHKIISPTPNIRSLRRNGNARYKSDNGLNGLEGNEEQQEIEIEKGGQENQESTLSDG